MTPDLDTAATKAYETLIKYKITKGPIDPFEVLSEIKGCVLISFAEVALQIEVDRAHLLQSINADSHDAMSVINDVNGKKMRFIVFNQRLPFYLIQRGLARELGHIILGHDGTRPEEVRLAEAQTFAYHFLAPRPLIKAVQESGIRFSTEVLGNMTGCFERCLSGMRKTPGTHVPAELNHLVRENFSDYITNFLDYQSLISESDESRDADFGTYMDGYEE